MTEEKRQIGKAEITAGTVKNIAVYLAAYLFAAVILTTTIGPVSLLPGLSGGLSFLYLPSLAATTMLFLSSLAGLTLAGKMATAISRSLMVLAVTFFISTATLTQNVVPGLGGLTIPLLVTGTVFALTITAASISSLAKTVSLAVFALAAGFLALAVPGLAGVPDGASIGWILLGGFIVAAVAMLPGIFRGHSNEYLAVTGDYFSRPEIPWVIGALCALAIGYFQYVRPILLAAIPLGVSALEWGVVLAVLISIGLRTLRFVRSVSQARKPGDLESLVQRIAYDRGSLESAYAVVQGFVDCGKKEGLIVYVTTALLENNVSPGAIEHILSGVVGYADEHEPALVLKWVAGDVAGKNRARRLALAGEIVSAATAAISKGDWIGPGEKAGAGLADGQPLSEVPDHSGGM